MEPFKAWSGAQRARIRGKSDRTKAFRYALNRWDAFAVFLDDGSVAIDNNSAERNIKPLVIVRGNVFFAGSDAGAKPSPAP